MSLFKNNEHYISVDIRAQRNLQKAQKITRFIRREENRLRKKFPILQYQNFLGLAIFTVSSIGMFVFTFLYLENLLPIWVLVVGNAIFASILHELEHDLIHGLYFKNTHIAKFMMYGVWLLRGNTPNPFYRKKIHLLHHKVSGQFNDIEEQMIGNGMKWGLKRILTMLDHNFSFLTNVQRVQKTSPELNVKEMAKASFPVMWIYYFVWYGFFILWLFETLFKLKIPFFTIWETLFFAYGLPNFIRQSSLQIISSNMHYFGDILPGKAGLMEQTQILRPLWLLPLQIFCFNFGTTHSIHHFVVNEPFYLRQMVAFRAIPYMKKMGVRYNDINSFFHQNRYNSTHS